MCDCVELGLVMLGGLAVGVTRWIMQTATALAASAEMRPEKRDLYDPPRPPRLPDIDEGWDVV